jgi:sensor histidine kinase YesM
MQQSSSIRSKIFSSMFFSQSLITLVMACALSIVFFNFYLNKQTNFAFEKLNLIDTQLNFLTTSISNYSRIIVSDDEVQNFMLCSKKDALSKAAPMPSDIKAKINHLIQSTNYIHSVSLYDANFNCILSTANSMICLPFLQKNFPNEGTWVNTQKKDNGHVYGMVEILSYIKPFYNYNSGELLGFIEISLLESEIKNLYNLHNLTDSTTFILDQNGNIVSTNSLTDAYQLPYPYYEFLNPTLSSHFFFKDRQTIFFKYTQALNGYVVTQIPAFTLFAPLYVFILLCIVLAFCCLMACRPFLQRMSKSITSPITKLITHTHIIKSGVLLPLKIPSEAPSDLADLICAFNELVESQEVLKTQLISSQKAKDKLAVDLLQEQINPHFLYNTLDNISALAEIGEIELLTKLIYNLSQFYRKGLSNGKTYITIQEELEMVASYMQILQIRYYNKFDFEILCPPELKQIPCLKFLLQPIVENSIYHGIKNLEGHGTILIEVNQKDKKTIAFCIKDNGVGLSETTVKELFKKQSSHFGLYNIQERLHLYYGQAYGISIQGLYPTGCAVTLTIHPKGGIDNDL